MSLVKNNLRYRLIICCSQNLNYINKEIRIKNDYSKSVDDQEDKKNKNDKDNNINTDDFRIQSDYKLNFNFNIKEIILSI